MLNTVEYDGPGETPVVIAHGLFGSARNWNVIARRLSALRRVVVVDMRNHGSSFHDADHSYPSLAEDLARVIEATADRAIVLGHSMGGKAAMVLALETPKLVDRLCVVDIAPVAYGHTQMPMIEAMRAVDLSQVTRRAEAETQLTRYIPEAPIRAFLLQSLDLGGDVPRWRLNLDALAEDMPGIIGFPDVSGTYDGPTLFLAGGASDYVTPAHHSKIQGHFPRAQIESIPAAGHWVHAEAPNAFLQTFGGWLSDTD